MTLFFFGGSFDPPHRGHLAIIQYCCKHCEKLLLVPAKYSPLENRFPIAEGNHRIRMLELLIQDLDYYIEIDDWELTQLGPSFTYQTIRHLKEKYPDSNLSMVIGADQLIHFHKWNNYVEIMNSVQIIGFNRDNCNFTPPVEMKLSWLEEFKVDISSEEIREKIKKGILFDNELTPSVLHYIHKNTLYGY